MSFHMAQLCPDPFLPSGQDFLSSPVHALLKAPKIFFRAANRSWPLDIIWPKTDFVKEIPSCGWIKYSDCQHDQCMYVRQLFLFVSWLKWRPDSQTIFCRPFLLSCLNWALITVTKFSNLDFGHLHCISCPDFSIHVLGQHVSCLSY